MNNSSPSLLFLFCLFILFQFSNSITYSQTWTGGGDGVNWSDPANWDSGVPTQIGDAEIPTGMTATIGAGSTVDWTTGDLIGGGTLINEGEINISEVANKAFNGNTTLINDNLISFNNGNLFINDGHLINNSIFVFTSDGDNILAGASGSNDLTNNGSIIKDGGTGVSTIFININNQGTLYALTGEFRLSGGGTYSTGTNLLTATDALLSFESGIHNLDGMIIGHSEGQIEMRTTMEIQSMATLNIENKGIECTDCTFRGGGTLNFLDKLSMTTAGNKTINGMTDIVISDTLEINDGNSFINDGHLINDGVILFTADGDNIIASGAGRHDLTNNGTIVKEGGNSSTSVSVNLINTGGINVRTGTLLLTSNGQYSTGTNLSTSVGAVLAFNSGTATFDGLIIGNSLGEIEMRTIISIPNSAEINIEGNGIECTDCNLSGGGTLNFLDKLSMTTAGNKTISGMTDIIISDTLEINDGNSFINNGHLLNDGVILFTADGDNIIASGVGQHDLTNTGAIVKEGGNSSTNISVNIINTSSIDVRTGTLLLTSSGQYSTGTNLSTSVGAVLAFNSGTATFNGLITGNSLGEIEMRTTILTSTSTEIDIEGNGIECTDCAFTGGGKVNLLDKLVFSTIGNKTISGQTEIIIQDSLIHEDGNFFFNGGSIINNGVYLFTADGDNIFFSGANLRDFINNGDIIKDGGVLTTTISANTVNHGNTIVRTGTLTFSNNLNSSVEDAIYIGEGRINATVPAVDIVSGTFSPGITLFQTGILTIGGDIDTARFIIDITGPPTTAGVDFDQVDFDGDIDLVDFIDINLFHRPVVGDTYNVVLAGNIANGEIPFRINSFFEGCNHQFEVVVTATMIQLEYVGIVGGPDEDPLLALYFATDGPNWTNNTNWGTGCPCDTQSPWANVECFNGRVTKLFLNSNNLTGTIPADIGQLTELRTLNLSNNNLTGSIPSTVGDLVNMEVFQAFGNDLTGAIPEEITQCTDLIDIRLQNNNLGGPLPTNLGNLTMLTSLLLSNNSITGPIPSSIGGLSSVTNIFLNFNQLSGSIPSTIGNLSNVTQLRLSGNMLTGDIPPEIGMLDNMTLLWLQSNQLSGGIPIEIMNCSSLITILTTQNPNMDGCYDTRLQLLDSQWNTSSHVNISAGTQMANWDNFILNGTGTCCFDSINETCASGPCEFFDGAVWQAEGNVIYSGDHLVENGISVTLNSSSTVELEATFEVKAGGELNIPMTGCDEDDIPGGAEN